MGNVCVCVLVSACMCLWVAGRVRVRACAGGGRGCGRVCVRRRRCGCVRARAHFECAWARAQCRVCAGARACARGTEASLSTFRLLGQFQQFKPVSHSSRSLSDKKSNLPLLGTAEWRLRNKTCCDGRWRCCTVISNSIANNIQQCK